MRTEGLLRAEPQALPPGILLPQAAARVGRLAALGFKKMQARHAQTRRFKEDTLRRVRTGQTHQHGNRQRLWRWLGAQQLERNRSVRPQLNHFGTPARTVHKTNKNQSTDFCA